MICQCRKQNAACHCAEETKCDALSENQIDSQKEKVLTNESRHRPTERGDASNICLSNAILANCQSNSQNAMVQSFILFFFLVCVVVEIIIW